MICCFGCGKREEDGRVVWTAGGPEADNGLLLLDSTLSLGSSSCGRCNGSMKLMLRSCGCSVALLKRKTLS